MRSAANCPGASRLSPGMYQVASSTTRSAPASSAASHSVLTMGSMTHLPSSRVSAATLAGGVEFPGRTGAPSGATGDPTVMLIGMFDSPFVRRVAISMKLLGIGFEHRDWSVGRDFDRIRAYNPLGRVPTLLADDGETLIDSAAILDYLDDLVGPARALLPAGGAARRAALRVVAIAVGAAEKRGPQAYERGFRPYGTRHEPRPEPPRTRTSRARAAPRR